MKILPNTKLYRKAIKFLDGDGWTESHWEIHAESDEGDKVFLNVTSIHRTEYDEEKKVTSSQTCYFNQGREFPSLAMAAANEGHEFYCRQNG